MIEWLTLGLFCAGLTLCLVLDAPVLCALAAGLVLFLLYGRADFEKMTHRKYEYLTGVNGHFEIALYVDAFEEVDEAFRRAVDQGAAPILAPTTEPWGQRTCYIADPEGNLIEIGSWNKPYEEKDR